MIVTSIRTRAALCAAGAAVFAALTAGTAIAGADANDDAFVAAVQQTGTKFTNPAGAPALGRQICTDLGKGTSPDQIAADLMAYTAPDGTFLSQQQANGIIAAAKKSYCP